MNKQQTEYKITKELVSNIRHRLSFGLIKGNGDGQENGQMCVENVICAAFGLPPSDNPPCVGEEVRRTKIALNDSNWPSTEARAKGMEKLAIAQLGSNALDQDEFKERLFHKSCQILLPLIIQIQIDDKTQIDKVDSLKQWKEKFKNSTLESVKDLWKEFYNYYYYYYNYYCNNYYYNYYNNYYNNYYCNNYYNYYCNNYYNNHYNNYYYYIPNFLESVAQTILEVLQDMNCEGCKWI